MADAILKTCRKCNLALPPTDFSPDKRASDGLQSRCRSCCRADKRARYEADSEAARARRRAYFAANRERVLESNKRSRARRPETVKAAKKAWYESVKNRPDWKARRDARTAEKKDWKREYDRAYRAKNAEKVLARAKAWRANNPETRRMIVFTYDAKRRAWEKSGDPTSKIREWVKAQKKVCHWCKSKCAQDFHIDHIQPLSRGGQHVTTNLCIACPKCNITKNARDPIEFAQSLGLLL